MKLIALLLSSFLLVSQALAEPAELTSARLDYEAKLAVPKGKLDAALLARGKQYASLIKALEDRASLGGNLDGVVLLKAEREAYEQGKRTYGFGANAAKVPPEARDARRIMEGDFARLRATAAPEGRRLSGEYVKALEGIERKLTMQKDVAGALDVRKEKTEIQDEEMDPFTEGRNLCVGAWQFLDKQGDNVIYKFNRNGTWTELNSGKTGKWQWADKQKRVFTTNYGARYGSDRDTISADGKEIAAESAWWPGRKIRRLP